MFKLTFFLLLSFSFSTVCYSNSDDLYNTKAATSDLHWTSYSPHKGWEEVTSLDRDGRPIRSYQVCNLKEKYSSWVRTPFIASKGGKRAYIDVEFSMRECDDLDSDCRETFNMYYFESDTDRASSTFPPWRENPYVKIDTIAAGERFGSSNAGRAKGVNFKTWTLGPLTKNGFYIAAEDQGACMSILSLRVYFFYCPEVVEGLAFFRRTVSGNKTASLDDVEGICVPNSNITSPHGSRYHCNSNGEWKVLTGSCHCRPGYEANEELTACTACYAGRYKSTSGNHKCTACPSKSGSLSKEVSDHCPCHPGYFRASDDDIHQPCSKPPTAPRKLRSEANVTSVVLSWQRPSNDGGRSDLYYNVSCSECGENLNEIHCSLCPDDVIFSPTNRLHLSDTSCKLENLRPFTSYRLKVFALNGVTSQSKSPPAYEEISIVTREGVPSPVEHVEIISNRRGNLTISWSPPKPSNGRITKYQVMWTDRTASPGKSNPSSIYKSRDFETVENTAAIPDVIPGHTYAIRVRAATASGFGQYSDEIDVVATPKDINNKQSMTTILLVGILTLLVLSSLTAVMLYQCFKKRGWMFARKRDRDTDSEETIALHTSAELVVSLPSLPEKKDRTYVDYPDPYSAIMEFSCEINPSQLQIGDPIGQGEFGEVCRGVLRVDDVTVDVAVKKLKGGNSDQKNFLREASTMAQFSHPNIILLKGVITKSFPLMIVTEYMENGSLKSYLQKKHELTMLQLLDMLKGIASGMRYLSSMKYVHRDLAARNILVDSDLVCKVSDFGLSRNLENDPHATYTTQGGKIAIRWTAPESIRSRKFTSASDVWSYGIVMWEVMSYGEKPYWDMTNPGVLQSLDKGFRLPAPVGCPVSLHRLMVDCWAFDPKTRPTIDDVHRRINDLMQRPRSLTHVVQSHKIPKAYQDVVAA